MLSTLHAIHDHPRLALSVVVTGMHLLEEFGNTVEEIVAAGLPVAARVHVDMDPPSGATMARNIGRMLTQFVDVFESVRPDVVLLLGDRGEMLAGALAATHLSIPVVHIHGGERSGTIDEPVRHAISKLAHVHFTATQQAAERLVRMGERAGHVVVTGAPGLDGLEKLASIPRARLAADAGLCSELPIALFVYHPVLQEAASAGRDTEQLLDTLRGQGIQIVALMPNSDAGSDAVRVALAARRGENGFFLATHFPRERFVSWMACADLMIGNSSSGIIEAGSFGTPVINIGNRQGPRERNANVRDVPELAATALIEAVQAALMQGPFPKQNVYAMSGTAGRIAGLLDTLDLDQSILAKTNAY
jgi:GDP/UDP-N,N'-diacetylbacillosamine 2-epimerase (hydrolysing)